MFKKLKEMGILGINRRVGEFILPYNPRHLYPLVDNKILTHNLCIQNGIPSPTHYWQVRSHGQLKELSTHLSQYSSFAIKPCRGAMGNGILIVNNVEWSESNERWVFSTSKGDLNRKDLEYFISDILSGMYSLNGLPDEAIIQEKLSPHPEMARFSYKGIADIRVIVFQGYPVMGMLRLPTSLSRGRANLHQGAVGCGIDLSNGTVSHAIWQNRHVTHHPDTEEKFESLQLPYWQQILMMAVKCYEITKMGYLGVDIVLDEERGPLLLEMNARPGLSIQTANRKGLVPRLRLIQQQPVDCPAHEKVKFAMNHFQASSQSL
jgi:alpha-L-glutamate ligase-like protein